MKRGIALYEKGKGGKGLKPETVKWAYHFAQGGEITYARAVEMRGWFARFRFNGPAARSRATRPDGPAMVSWLLRGGDDGEQWARDAADYLIPLEEEF